MLHFTASDFRWGNFFLVFVDHLYVLFYKFSVYNFGHFGYLAYWKASDFGVFLYKASFLCFLLVFAFLLILSLSMSFIMSLNLLYFLGIL